MKSYHTQLVAAFLLIISSYSYGSAIEQLIMPGPLSAAHAEEEENCGACHATFNAEAEKGLCLECHEEIASDLSQASGFHGRYPGIGQQQCRTCHTEHEGREFDISGLVTETFDHTFTNFPLTGAHQTATCTQCHATTDSYREADPACVSCHLEDDAHNSGLGEDCGSCHVTDTWVDTTFDHSEATGFALLGAHADATCGSCHLDNQFSDTGSECIDCHRLDDVHNGNRGAECQSCHTVKSWAESSFDHAKETGFALTGAHTTATCASCHQADLAVTNPPTDCVGCHSNDDVHLNARGSDCAQCHTTKTWQTSFDHAQETGFALTGAHESLSCSSCHTGELTDPLPTTCAGCHETSDPHENTLGDCSECHRTNTWLDNIRFDHEFTRFPLVGLHQTQTCEQCHDSLVFGEAPEQCSDCHEDYHQGVFPTDCATCHHPGGWQLWRFDHNTQTDFLLEGVHETLSCDSCHNVETSSADNQPGDCQACHLQDDVHGGQFGRQCGRCHSTTSFTDGVELR